MLKAFFEKFEPNETNVRFINFIFVNLLCDGRTNNERIRLTFDTNGTVSVSMVMIHPGVCCTQCRWPLRVAPCNGESSAPDQVLAVVVSSRLLPRTTTTPTAPGTEECAAAATIKARGVLGVAAAWLLCIIVAAVASCGGEARIPCILVLVWCSNGPLM
jgi:hypothetical protein